MLGETWIESRDPAKAISSPREGRPCRSEPAPGARHARARLRRGGADRARRPSPRGRPPDGRGRQRAPPAGPRVPRDGPGRGRDQDPGRLPGAPQGQQGPASRPTRRSSRSRRPSLAARGGTMRALGPTSIVSSLLAAAVANSGAVRGRRGVRARAAVVTLAGRRRARRPATGLRAQRARARGSLRERRAALPSRAPAPRVGAGVPRLLSPDGPRLPGRSRRRSRHGPAVRHGSGALPCGRRPETGTSRPA